MTGSVLDAGALETNRGGRLTDTQRSGFAAAERAFTRELRGVAVVLAAIGLLVAFGAAATVPAITRLLVAAAFLVAGGAAGWFSLVGRPGLERDLRDGRVVTVEGAIGRDRVQGQGAQPSTYYLMIDGRRYRCSRDAYEAAAEPGIVRLYVLPKSGRVVNFERLPDRPLPEGALASPAVATAAVDAVREVLLHPGGGRTEALATAVAVEHAMLGGAAAAGAAGAAAETDPTETKGAGPLAEAIVGRWRNPMAELTFSADGTASAAMATGMRLDGRWSVDDAGRLRVVGLDEDMVTEAKIAGDTLTIEWRSTPMSFRRAAA